MPSASHAPESIPVLSRGKHRNARRGACFMELASFLAGERWSDRPACTRPLLADVARHVNDYTSDENRPRLAVMIPSVIGLTGEDPETDARIAWRCAALALPVVSAERQRVLAVGLLSAAVLLGDRDAGTAQALAAVPDAERWARQFVQNVHTGRTLRRFARHGAPAVVHNASQGVVHWCVPDRDARLRAMLLAAIEECTPRPTAPVTVDDTRWSQACALTR